MKNEKQGAKGIVMSKVKSIDDVKSILIKNIDVIYKNHKEVIDKIIAEDDCYLLAEINVVNEAGKEELTN